MTGAQAIELWGSLSLQACLLIGLTAALGTRQFTDRGRDRLWCACLVALLLVAAGDLLLPHLRLWHSCSDALLVHDEQSGIVWRRLGDGLLLVWLAGAAISLLTLIMNLIWGMSLVRQAEPVGRIYPDFATSLPLDPAALADVQLLTHPRIVGPFCWQFHRPAVVLPRFLLEYPAGELAAILRHELAHLRLGHPLWLFVQRLGAAVFWYHPAVAWGLRQASKYREFVCDDAAVGTPVETASYFRGLLRLAERHAPPTKSLAVGLPFSGNPAFLTERVTRMETMARPDSLYTSHRHSAWLPLVTAPIVMLAVWLPLDGGASRRSVWSPWPRWTASCLQTVGISVRDYEVDNHRLGADEFPHFHQSSPDEGWRQEL